MTLFQQLYGRKYRRYIKNKKKVSVKKAYSILNQYTMRPEALESYKAIIRNNEKFREALLRDKTNAFNRILDFVCSQVQNIFIIVQGFPGTGKSTLSRSVVLDLQERRKKLRNIKGRILLSYTQRQMVDMFQEVKRGDIIFKDENPIIHGFGSRMLLDAIINFMGVVRDQEISAILVSPRIFKNTEFGLANIYLVPLGWDEKTKENRALWLDQDGNYIGIVRIPFKTNKKLEQKMEQMKRELQERLKENKGNLWIGLDPDLIKRDVNKVLKYYETHPLPPRLSVAGIRRDFWDIGIAGNERYLEAVASSVYKILYYEREKEKQKDQEDNNNDKNIKNMEEMKNNIKTLFKDKIEYEIFLEKTQKDENFLKLVLEELKKEKITKEELNMFRRIIDGEPYHKIKKDLKLSTLRIITETKNKIQQNYLGFAGERAYKQYLELLNKAIVYMGGYSKDPDFIIHSDNEVHSFKCYSFENDKYAIKKIARSELETALKKIYNIKIKK